MKSLEFISRNSSPYSFWNGYVGLLIAQNDAQEASDIAYNEALADAIAQVTKYEGINIQLADILKRELEKLKVKI